MHSRRRKDELKNQKTLWGHEKWSIFCCMEEAGHGGALVQQLQGLRCEVALSWLETVKLCDALIGLDV